MLLGEVDNGQVNNIVVTDPGGGYTGNVPKVGRYGRPFVCFVYEFVDFSLYLCSFLGQLFVLHFSCFFCLLWFRSVSDVQCIGAEGVVFLCRPRGHLMI